MRYFIKQIIIVVLLTVSLTACQKEKQEFIDDTNDEETIALDSVLTGMLLSASQNNGYLDNIIDGNGCISVSLPVTVIVNGQEVIIQQPSDYQLILDIFNSFENDIDTLEIVFPIRVIFEDYQDIEVGSLQVLTGIIEACVNEVDDTYTCVDFIYPIQCYTYDHITEETGLVSLNNNAEWFWYLNYLDEDNYITIKYPMVVVVDGISNVIQNNDELLVLMNQVNCDLDEGIDADKFLAYLLKGDWYVNLLNEDGADSTCEYLGYIFEFSSDGTLTATTYSEVRNGTWSMELVANEWILELFFDCIDPNDPLENLNHTWVIFNSSSQRMKLKVANSSGEAYDYLYFGRDPAINCTSGNGQLLVTTLQSGLWGIESFLDDGNDETSNYVGYEIAFENGGIAVASRGIYTYYGSWEVTGTDEPDLSLDFGTQIPLDDLNKNWDVTGFNDDSITLDEMGSGTDQLVLFKI
ncbi:MAG: hypothetical protein KJO23_00450 [Bacteroidia bacterium]|nr:hypothetical protein [Bacteroidia bacterium]NNM24176.1 hypothetical protein [Flavobacteriaceae bacterium]